MCIYYKDIEELHYKSGEHIISAAIGGKQKLPKGYVSDEFNTFISTLEGQLFKSSLVSIPRDFEGPGKRGSLSPTKASKSRILIIADRNDPSKCSLGYMSVGKLHEIPCISLDIKSGAYTLGVPNTGDHKKIVDRFIEKVLEPEKLKIKTIYNNKIPKGIILLGVMDDIDKHYDAFLSKNETETAELNFDIYKGFGQGLIDRSDEPTNATFKPRVHGTITVTQDHFRVFAKIAFNFLAFNKGDEYVLNEKFDRIRNWIVNGGDQGFAAMNNKKNPLAIVAPLPESAHSIQIYKFDNYLLANVYLFDSLGVTIDLCDIFHEEFEPITFICDWRIMKEYDLETYTHSLLNSSE